MPAARPFRRRSAVAALLPVRAASATVAVPVIVVGAAAVVGHGDADVVAALFGVGVATP